MLGPKHASSVKTVKRQQNRVWVVSVTCLFLWCKERHRPASHLKTDLSWLSKQGLWCQMCVWVRTPQVCRAARALDGNLIGRWGSKPRRRVRCWTKTTRVHRRVVEFFTASTIPVTFHCPTCEKTVAVRKNWKQSCRSTADMVLYSPDVLMYQWL